MKYTHETFTITLTAAGREYNDNGKHGRYVINGTLRNAGELIYSEKGMLSPYPVTDSRAAGSFLAFARHDYDADATLKNWMAGDKQYQRHELFLENDAEGLYNWQVELDKSDESG